MLNDEREIYVDPNDHKEYSEHDVDRQDLDFEE